jgi:prepilin-type processing-associated H-X9-DG protein
MNEHCPTCGKPLPVGSGGSCPSCLMSLGLAPFSPEANTPPPSNLEPEVPAGQSIGPYRLLKRIGEGGFGTVWMAQQVEPIRRQIALKILKPGMDSAQVVLRFEAERQALALMDHPNVARVIDGGTTEKGTPYFAMELVPGVPVTTYCDERRLGVIERVRLFLPVCRAVQHAHQKGIIHRDLKPSNILVAELEGTAVPKVVDFGIAKATQERLTEKTLHTHLHQLLGTPAHMSPEQVHLGGLDIDSRSDIYSLGALLFELLTGTTPFDPRQTETGGLEALLRAIRETDIPKPSSLFVFVDEHPDSLDTTAFWTSPARGDAAKFLSYPASYHDGGGACSFADGHVEWHGWRDASTRIPVTGRNDLAETDSPNNVDLQWLQERNLLSQEQ